MEDLEMTQALRRHVEAGEPPFPLTANALIAQARRRQRWRVGLGIGGGGAATALVVVSAMALVPTGGPAFQLASGCDVELPLGIRATVPPTGQPIPVGSGATSTATPIPDASKYAYIPPTSIPPSGEPIPTGKPIPGGKAIPSDEAVPGVDPPPSGKVPPVPGGASAIPPKPPFLGDVGKARVEEMSCFLKRRLKELRPEAKYSSTPVPPMEVVRKPELRPDQEWTAIYTASAQLIDGPLLCTIKVTVYPGEWGFEPGLKREAFQTIAVVRTATSSIVVIVEGGAISDDQAMELAKAPELDVYR